MIDPLTVAIGVGLVISLMFSELFGLAAGGMVVPGYVAVSLSSPLDVLLTLVVAFVTFAIVHTVSSIAIVYGRRRTVLTILVGYLLGAIARNLTSDWVMTTQAAPELTVIGFIIPGLIAIWMARQGVVETVSALITASVAIRLILILIGLEELQ
ncbi:MAG: poly-gamma-glutamate biosynthesis protein PgsC [Myxococcales bacterium]|nr:poly-gamma-glutamate biosynthesis protein PgsC [Myxococcales bacterium]